MRPHFVFRERGAGGRRHFTCPLLCISFFWFVCYYLLVSFFSPFVIARCLSSKTNHVEMLGGRIAPEKSRAAAGSILPGGWQRPNPELRRRTANDIVDFNKGRSSSPKSCRILGAGSVLKNEKSNFHVSSTSLLKIFTNV